MEREGGKHPPPPPVQHQPKKPGMNRVKHLDEIKIFLDEKKKPHIMGLNETKLDSSIGDDEISIEAIV